MSEGANPQYPKDCPVCGREPLAEHHEEDDDGNPVYFRVCDNDDVTERHQWREDGKVWSNRQKEWRDAEDVDFVWDMQDPDAPYMEEYYVE